MDTLKVRAFGQRMWFGNTVNSLMAISLLHLISDCFVAETIWSACMLLLFVLLLFDGDAHFSRQFFHLLAAGVRCVGKQFSRCVLFSICVSASTVVEHDRVCWLWFSYISVVLFYFSSICRLLFDRALSFSRDICSVLMVVSISWFCFHLIFIAFRFFFFLQLANKRIQFWFESEKTGAQHISKYGQITVSS